MSRSVKNGAYRLYLVTNSCFLTVDQLIPQQPSGKWLNNYNGELAYFGHFFSFKYLNVNICFYILSLSTDVFEHIEFDDDLEEILEAICKFFYTFYVVWFNI